MLELPLVGGNFALVDDEDFHWLERGTWYELKREYTNYVGRRDGSSVILLHRELLMAKSGQQVDHTDKNGLNNQKSNLRLVTASQNVRANSGNINSYSGGVKGVSWHRQSGKWRATITLNGKQQSLGLHDTVTEAAVVYNKWAKHYFGEYAYLNPITP